MNTKRCDDINELHPKVKELAQKLMAESKKQGLNMKIIDTYRSKERQDELYAQGRTKPGKIVTNAKGSDMSSYHNWRLAFDCIQNQKGEEYDSKFLAKLGKIGQSLGLEWGGGWSGFSDAPHFQYTFGLSIKDLKSGKKPPAYMPQIVDEEYKRAVIKLSQKLGINMAAWYPEPNPKNLIALVQKIGRKIYGVSDYKFIINHMKQDGIIGNEILWLEHEYSIGNIKSLIKKVAAKV